MRIIAYLLARSIALQTGETVEDILGDALAATETTGDASADAVERIYRLYPAKCPTRGTTTGKCAKNKLQIKRLLKDHAVGDLEYTIKRYIDECAESGCYMKNFGTFLNQLPDYSSEGQDIFSPRGDDGPRPQQ